MKDISVDATERPLIFLDNISYTYQTRGAPLSILQGVSLGIQQGDDCAIVGASGSGKSTLLNILGLLDLPSSGQFFLSDRDVLATSADERADIRNREIGFIFQSFNLLAHLTALDNVALPLFYRGMSRQDSRELAWIQLDKVGLADRVKHRPADLSGGQRQRVAIARALVGDPSIILADEPTGNLDHSTSEDVLELLLALNKNAGVTLVMVTHDNVIASRFSRKIEVVRGQLVEANSAEKIISYA
ncbi:ABC transporter ATP-binding protein (plasmid) [Deefgea piscis]|uniref:ABC transporter ATP-binding protein n=1 Tax=Deefgea piscis TaxID=2739061 RepID=A0A6M8SXF8_9NEIS|nr:ABC transporter ATP-binding protein [Deefgea piscis]QKJ68296.1 ABC transporter ATP-binding protein [Deefgea piscis]